MFCKRCGKVIAEDSVFCQYCGADQTIVSEQETCESSNKETSNKKNVLKGIATGIASAASAVLLENVAETAKEVANYSVDELHKGAKKKGKKIVKKGKKFVDNSLKKTGFKSRTLTDKVKDGLKNVKITRNK